MDVAQFLSRVVAPGNFVAVCYKKPGQDGMGQRFFPRDKLAEAASFISWADGQGMDTWYAVASYTMAQPRDKADRRGNPTYRGERTQANVHGLRAFWIDIDIKRAGDKKQPDKVYADVPSAVAWLKTFLDATGLPRPNLWVSSGYGLHVYWVVEDAMLPQEWQPYANALKAAMIANGATLDVGLSSDSARILRPPQTRNHKEPVSPMPVQVMTQLSAGDYPNQLVYQGLQAYLVQGQALAVNYGSSAAIAGAPPAVLAQRRAAQQQGTMQAAQANMPQFHRLFSEIAQKCKQVELSVANQGHGDPYPLWYLGHLSLASFCSDGGQYIHIVSCADPRYDFAKTEAAFQQIKAEHQRKGTGAPTCAHYERSRPGLCQTCPHFGRVTSPFSLGLPGSTGLPLGYRNHNSDLQAEDVDKDGNVSWNTIVGGDFLKPMLEKLENDYRITFTYQHAAQSTSYVSVKQSEVPTDARGAVKVFGGQGISGVYTHNAIHLGRFIVAWINELRAAGAARDPVPSFGWSHDKDGYAGFSVGGVVYWKDGSQHVAPGGDETENRRHTPKGTLPLWQSACERVMTGRPDLQVLIAAAFSAPLVEMTGEAGFAMSAWSQHSAVGKSSALKVGNAVWAGPAAMFQMNDTENSIHKRLGIRRTMPSFWDEVKVENDKEAGFVRTLFRLAQGFDKSRLNADTSVREGGNWKTTLTMTGNRPLMDHIAHAHNNTDAGALRLFEFEITAKRPPYDATAAAIVARTEQNYGHAGRAYAAWLAENAAAAQKMVQGLQGALATRLGPCEASERFHLAGMATLLAGASIANGLQLTKFDVPAMFKFLGDEFTAMRAARAGDFVVNGPTGLNIEEVFGEFVTAHAHRRLIASGFAKQRTGAANIQMHVQPQPGKDPLAIHQIPQVMRITEDSLRTWLRTRGLSFRVVFDAMQSQWNASKGRSVLGLNYCRTGNIRYVELPLVAPELVQYNYSNDSKGT